MAFFIRGLNTDIEVLGCKLTCYMTEHPLTGPHRYFKYRNVTVQFSFCLLREACDSQETESPTTILFQNIIKYYVNETARLISRSTGWGW